MRDQAEVGQVTLHVGVERLAVVWLLLMSGPLEMIVRMMMMRMMRMMMVVTRLDGLVAFDGGRHEERILGERRTIASQYFLELVGQLP